MPWHGHIKKLAMVTKLRLQRHGEGKTSSSPERKANRPDLVYRVGIPFDKTVQMRAKHNNQIESNRPAGLQQKVKTSRPRTSSVGVLLVQVIICTTLPP